MDKSHIIKVPRGTVVKCEGHAMQLVESIYIRGCDVDDETQFEVMDYEPTDKKPSGSR
ncbi:hypothetical protein [Neptuniibacter sp.]|uniref:hypothetical protein n=1 Tax=Neptuniibacter sp. TaxID=1962643 RepID=UPI002617B07C|nr:hypothetical protein [Neptuniibacter sp.]MCP4597040.1 hypothetical protein [Neptuniibacter sp.]